MGNQNENILTQYDLKQIRLMISKIDLFESKIIDLFDLVGDLKGLLNALESVNESWRNKVLTEINTLEILVDSIVDGSISRWRENPKNDETRAILLLKSMCNLLLENYYKQSDPSISEYAEIVNNQWLICSHCRDAWETASEDAMVVCPHCDRALHNPRHKRIHE